MKKATLIGSILLLSNLIISCTRKDENNAAGKGGNATLRITPKHHNEAKYIINGKIYIKYNVQDAPANFDDSTNCINVNETSIGTFSNLKKGFYYIVGVGYDTSISQAVKGGIPYEIKDETTFEISLPVTESH